MTIAVTVAEPMYPLPVVLELLRADAPPMITGAPQDWPRWSVLLPHVLAATSHVEGVPAPGNPAGSGAAWLLDRAAAYLQVHGRFHETRPLAGCALAFAEAAYGLDHPAVAPYLNNLATILQDLGRPEDARRLAERALDITEAGQGPDYPDVALAQSNIEHLRRIPESTTDG